jgi:aerobic carbon-monoxide dehydrogenase small subunit
MNEQDVSLMVNGEQVNLRVEPRRTLADALRVDLGLVGTKLGCEHGSCGACTVLLDGSAIRSCLMFCVQAQDSEITTVEGLSRTSDLNELQRAFQEHHALQCGFCTPGYLLSISEFLTDAKSPTEEEIREALSGNICRCTGYHGIVEAVKSLVAERSGAAT